MVYQYRDRLRENHENHENYVEIDLEDLKSWDSKLHDAFVQKPNEYLPMVGIASRALGF